MLRTLRIALGVAAALLIAPPAVLFAAGPLDLDDETARINYSLGYQIGGDFKRQGVTMNPEAVVRGIEDALAGGKPLIPPAEMKTTLMELKRKVVTEQRVQRRNNELQYLAEGKQFLADNAGRPGVKTTASGLQYKVIEPGKGRTPGPTDAVTVNYRGTLTNGNVFDSSYDRGEPASFSLDGVIKGWTEGLQLIGEGGHIQLFIAPELAYGNRGPMAHRTLVFDVELLTVKPADQAAAGAKTP